MEKVNYSCHIYSSTFIYFYGSYAAASAEKRSEHPLGEAIVKGAVEKGLEFKTLDSFKAIPGHGIEVKIDGINILLGNRKLMVDSNISLNNLEKTSDKLAGEGNQQ